MSSTSPPDDGTDPRLTTALARVRATIEGQDDVAAVQALLAAGVLLFSRMEADGRACDTFGPLRPSQTDVAVTVCAMIRAVDIDMPQLVMFQAIGTGGVAT